MACERYHEALTDVAAGAPAPAGVEAHLAACEGCRADLAALRQALAVADAEMAGLVAAQPSPELGARIRQAVAEAEPSPAWRLGWVWPATAAAATLLVALAVWVGRAPSPGPHLAVDGRAQRSTVATRTAESTPAPVIPRDLRLPGPEGSAIPSDPSSPGSNRAPRDDRAPAVGDRRSLPRARAATVGVPRDDSPEVLVPPGEAEALLRFVALVHRERLAPAVLVAAGQPSLDLAELTPIDIKPLEIVPLDPAESSGT